MTTAKQQPQRELISTSETLRLIGKKSRSTLYELMRSDKTFPKPVRITDFSIAFRYPEIMAWIESRPRVVLAGISAIELRKQRKHAGELA